MRPILHWAAAALIASAACGGASARDAELPPGRSRPFLEHNWPHPRDLQFAAAAFAPPDARPALVMTSTGLRAFVIHDASERVVFEDKVVTGAGVSAGIDMALTLAGRLWGEDTAKAIQLGNEYDPQPPYDSGSPAKASKAVADLVRAVEAAQT